MKARPIGDRIIVKPENIAETSEGGIIIPDRARPKAVKGEVMAIGIGRLGGASDIVPLEVKTGDIIIYREGSGYPVDIKEEKYLVMNELDIMVIL